MIGREGEGSALYERRDWYRPRKSTQESGAKGGGRERLRGEGNAGWVGRTVEDSTPANEVSSAALRQAASQWPAWPLPTHQIRPHSPHA